MSSPRELVEAALRREEVDRIPFCPPFQGYWALDYAGISVMDSIKNPKLAAKAQFDVIDDCHIDGVETMWDWLLPAEAAGCEVSIPEFGTIPTISHIIDGPGDLEGLEVPEIKDFYRLAGARETTRIMAEKIGKERYLTASLLSPFTLAGELRGVEQLMMDCIMEESFVDALVEKSLEINIRFVEDMVRWDIDAITICDPTASGGLISGRDYARYSKNSTKALGDVARKGGKYAISHICGDTTDRLGHVADTGCVAFSVDYQVDVGKAVSEVGGRIAVIGNINPAAVLFSGTSERVRDVTLEILEKGGKRGFLLGSGCDIPVGAAYENVRAISEVFMGY